MLAALAALALSAAPAKPAAKPAAEPARPAMGSAACPGAAGEYQVCEVPNKPAALATEEELARMNRVGQSALSARVPRYPNAEEDPVPVGDALEAHGVPMNVQSFSTYDPPRQVLDFYKQHFAKSHLPMMGDGDFVRRFPYPSISVFDQMAGVDIHVVAIPDPATHRTMVLLALSDILAMEKRAAAEDQKQFAGLPEYPSADEPSAMTATDGEKRTVTVNFSTPDPTAKVVEFYKGKMAEQGFRVREQPESTAASRVFEFSRDKQTWHLVASFDAEHKRTAVMATHLDEPTPEAEP